MSMYQYAVQQGASTVASAITGYSAAGDAAYNAEYASVTAKFNAREARHTVELNMSAIAQDQVLTNTGIKLNQARARASAVIAAATSGSEGGSLDAVLYETERTAAFAKRSSMEQAEQSKETLFSQISSLNESQFDIAEPSVDFTTQLLGLVGSIDDTDLNRWGLSIDDTDGSTTNEQP